MVIGKPSTCTYQRRTHTFEHLSEVARLHLTSTMLTSAMLKADADKPMLTSVIADKRDAEESDADWVQPLDLPRRAAALWNV